jgi:hypothetical protein
MFSWLHSEGDAISTYEHGYSCHVLYIGHCVIVCVM